MIMVSVRMYEPASMNMIDFPEYLVIAAWNAAVSTVTPSPALSISVESDNFDTETSLLRQDFSSEQTQMQRRCHTAVLADLEKGLLVEDCIQ
jgi:hypothetical protein